MFAGHFVFAFGKNKMPRSLLTGLHGAKKPIIVWMYSLQTIIGYVFSWLGYFD